MNKKVSTVLFILIIGLFLISTVNAADTSPIDDGVSTSNEHEITSDLSNDDIQSMFDNANDGDTFKFTSKEYNDVSLVVDKNLSIISEKNSIVNAANTVSDKAKSLGISKTFGFYFTSNSAGSILSGITIVETLKSPTIQLLGQQIPGWLKTHRKFHWQAMIFQKPAKMEFSFRTSNIATFPRITFTIISVPVLKSTIWIIVLS